MKLIKKYHPWHSKMFITLTKRQLELTRQLSLLICNRIWSVDTPGVRYLVSYEKITPTICEINKVMDTFGICIEGTAKTKNIKGEEMIHCNSLDMELYFEIYRDRLEFNVHYKGKSIHYDSLAAWIGHWAKKPKGLTQMLESAILRLL